MLKVTTIRTCLTTLLLTLCHSGFTLAAAADLTLVRDGKSDYSIALPAQPSPAESLAAVEVARHVKAMCGAELARGQGDQLPAHAIVVCERGHLAGLLQSQMPPEVLKAEGDSFAVVPQGERVLIVGGRGRSTLTAAYRFCEALGCRFLAPTFDHYRSSAEYVPHATTLTFPGRAIAATPALAYRKLYVEEGLTHDITSLRQLAEWMPKAGYNVLVTPTNYQGHDRVKWDNWRVDLTPELQKRDIIIEVGGHGYQNFIRADMPDPSGQGTLFDKHPDWFARELAKLRPGLRAECIAYSHFTQAPTVPLDPSVLVDFCPINQSFAVQIDDPAARTNADYVRDLQGWRKAFGGDISIYSYYRKYAWQSLPTVLPHYIQKDLQFYAKVPVQGMSTYSEPGDWFAYELNHYALARQAWDPSLDVDVLIHDFCDHRYGSAAPVAMQALDLLEQTVRTHGTLPFTPRPPAPDLASAAGKIRDAMVKLEDAAASAKDPAVRYNLGRLSVCCEYACRDIDLARMKAEQRPAEEMQKGLGELEALIQSHLKEGVFAINGIRLGHKQLEDRYFGRRR